MKIAIIGGGFTGLTAAYRLSKLHHDVTIFEKDTVLGGLAHGFKQDNWDWSLEFAYHHIFTNDEDILRLVQELSFDDHLIIKRPITSTYIHGNIYQLDSPLSLLQFPELSFIDRMRTGMMLGLLKINPWWQPLEGYTAKQFFEPLGGKAGWENIWEPLMVGKFGNYADSIAASWLWARIKKRTESLGYFQGGFQSLINRLEKAIKDNGGKIVTEIQIDTIEQYNNMFTVTTKKPLNSLFDKVLLTVPTPLAAKLAPIIPKSYFEKPITIPHLHAQLLILETKESLLPDDIYWLNINDRSFPFLAAVAHTHFIETKYYGGNHITYFGNYLPADHPYLSMSKEQILKLFLPYMKKLNPNLSSKLMPISSHLFAGPFAQPVHQIHYSSFAPKLVTPIPNLYVANMDSVYPWDRGTNYAVKLGETAAKVMNTSI